MGFIKRYMTGMEVRSIKKVLLTVFLTLFMCVPHLAFAQQASCDAAPAAKSGVAPSGNSGAGLVDCIFKNGFEACMAEIAGYPDTDFDGFGALGSQSSIFCDSLTPGFAENAQDCDDNNNAKFPGNPEKCDSLDNDCNGAVDEVFVNLGTSCSVGVGMCQRTGSFVCSIDGFGEVCGAVPGEPQAEICDGIDNDCDGLIDDECTVGPIEIF